MQGHDEGSRRAWGALLNRAEQGVVAPTADDDLAEGVPQVVNRQDTDVGLNLSGFREIKKQIRTAIRGLRTNGVASQSPVPVVYDEYFKALGFSSVVRKDNGALKVVKIVDGKKVGTNLERAQVEKFLKDKLDEHEKIKDDVERRKSELAKKYSISPVSIQGVGVSNTEKPVPQGDGSEGLVFNLYPLEQGSLRYIQTIRGTKLESNADDYKRLPGQIFKILREVGVNPKPQKDGTFILEGVSNAGKADSDPMTKQEVVDFLLSIQASQGNGTSLEPVHEKGISADLDVTSQIQENHIEQNILDDMGIESVSQSQSDVGFGLVDVDEFETSTVLSGEKMYAEKDIADSLENERDVRRIFEREKEKIKQDAEEDLKVKWFDKEAFEFPERYDAVWDRFVATHPEKAVLYREHNPGIRSALERKEAKDVGIPKNELKSETPDAEDATDEVVFRFKRPLDISDAEIISERKRGEKKTFNLRFETEFGITKDQISEIEGYERLSEGQQKLVLETLREYARDTRGGFLDRTWEGILKATGRETKDKNYIEAVAVLIKNTAQFGPKVHEENGELFTDFIDVGISQQFRKEHKPIFDRFNALAHRYAKMKVEDLEDGIGTHSKDESKFVSFFKNTFSESRRKHDAYESLQESYENAKRELAQSLTEMGKSEGGIAEKLIQIDSKVHSLRFLQTEPEAVDVIKQNPDKSFWQKVGEKVFSKENMAYAGLGFVGRMALTGAMGLYAAPVVASAVGGIRSWNKASAELREKDHSMRMGKGNTNPEVLELQRKIKDIIQERNTLNTSSNMNDRVRDIELRQWLDKYNADLVSIAGTDLNIVDVTREIKVGQDGKKDVGLTQKLRDHIRDYKNETAKDNVTDEEKTKTLERIRARVTYVEDKLNLNRINFGSGAERSTNMANLFEVLGEARVLLADTEMPKGSELEARLEQYLVKREGLIQTRRRKKQIKTVAWGTLKAGAFALAGRELAEYGKETGFFDKVTSGVSGLFGENAPSPQDGVKIGYGSDQAIESSKLGSTVQEIQARGAIPESAPEIQKSAPYTIKAGDTLTNILKEQAPSIKDLGNTHAQENAVANILRSFTPDEMDSIGLGSHNIDNIRVNNSIDVEKLNAIIAEKHSIIESAQNRFGDEPVRSYTEASPRSGSQQGEILKNAGVSPKAGEAVTSGKGAGDIVLEQQAEDSSLRSEEAPPVEAQQKSPTPSEPTIQPASSPEKIIEIEDTPVKRIEANDHVPSKFPEEGVRIPKGLEGSDIASGQLAEDIPLRSEEALPAEVQPKSPILEEGLPEKPSTGAEPVASDVGTSQNSSLEGAPHVDVAPQQDLSEYESLKDSFGIEDEVDTVVPDQPQQTIEGVLINKHGVPIDETRPNVYKVKTIDGKEILISHGGGDLKLRVKEAYAYAEKNPGTTVYVEGASKVKSFGPPPMIAVTAPTGVVKDVEFNIMNFKTERTSTGDIDTNSFTERLTRR